MHVGRAIAGAVAVALLLISSSAGSSGIAVPGGLTSVYTGESPSGATWEAHVPPDPNGTLVLFSHGFRYAGVNPAWNASTTEQLRPLLEEGYSVVASSYATLNWALGTAEQDQLDALDEFTRQYEAGHGEFDRVLAFGHSMGGLITGRLAERDDTPIDGAIATCGVMAGGVDWTNRQFDGVFAAAVLLADAPDLQVSGFGAESDALATATRLSDAVGEARGTPAGRARLAVVGALLNTPTSTGVDESDADEISRDRARTIDNMMAVLIQRRALIADFAGGDPAWNAGTDYAGMIADSGQQDLLEELYREAGLDLQTDLQRLNAAADVSPDPEGLEWMQRTSTLTGDLTMPMLTTHTLRDVVVPVEFSGVYAQTVDRAGESDRLRQLHSDRTGHCRLSADETALAVELMERRLDGGEWPDVSAGSLGELGAETGRENLRYIDYRPPPFVSTRQWDGS